MRNNSKARKTQRREIAARNMAVSDSTKTGRVLEEFLDEDMHPKMLRKYDERTGNRLPGKQELFVAELERRIRNLARRRNAAYEMLDEIEI